MNRFCIAIISAVLSLSGAMAQTTAPEAMANEKKTVRFAWGASLTGTVDMSGNDMSTIGLEAYFGMKIPWVQMLGAGVGVDVPISNSLRQMPIFAIVRTNLRNSPSLCFLDLRGGMSVNDIEKNRHQTGAYVSTGLGFNLAATRNFYSHLIISYTYFGRADFAGADGEMVPCRDINGATIRFGITF